MENKAREQIQIVLVQRSPIKFSRSKSVSRLIAFVKQKMWAYAAEGPGSPDGHLFIHCVVLDNSLETSQAHRPRK